MRSIPSLAMLGVLSAMLFTKATAAQAEAGTSHRVWVTAPGGQPIAGAIVEVWESMEGAGIGNSLRHETDDSGLAEITIPKGWKALTAYKEGVGRSGVVESWRSYIRLVEMTRVRGQVLWSDGRPEPGAVVSGPDTNPRLTGMTLFDQALPSSPWLKATAVTTDAEGRFEIELAAGSEEVLHATSRGRTTVGRSPAWLQALDEPLVLRFPGQYSISGRVVGPDDLAATQVRAPDTYSVVPLESGVAGDGTFTLLLAAPATYPIAAQLEGWVQDNEVVVTVDDEHPTASVELHLVAAMAIAGRLRMPSGDPEHGGVKAVPEDVWDRHAAKPYGDPWARWISMFPVQGIADPQGSFTIGGLQPGKPYVLYTEPPWAKFQVLARGVHAGDGELDLIVQR